MSDDTTMPAVFIGHGSPMNALEHNRYTEAWHEFGRSIPVPRAILAISAHWYINATAVTAMERPRTIHDFYGFPQALFDVRYPAPGDPALAAEIAELVAPTWVGMDTDSWGLDHGTWSILVHMFPDADVPVVQLSIDAGKSGSYHVDLGAALEPLRRQGVLVFASGNVVHNLRRIDWNRPDAAYDWAVDYDEAARDLMANRPGGHRLVGRSSSPCIGVADAGPPAAAVLPRWTRGCGRFDGRCADRRVCDGLAVDDELHRSLNLRRLTVDAVIVSSCPS